MVSGSGGPGYSLFLPLSLMILTESPVQPETAHLPPTQDSSLGLLLQGQTRERGAEGLK